MIKKLIIIILLILIFALNINADELTVDDYITDEMKDCLPDDILNEDAEKGTVINYKTLISLVVNSFKDVLHDVFGNFFAIFGLVVISSCMNLFATTMKSGSLLKVFSYVSMLCFAVVLYGILNDLWGDMSELFSKINVLMNGITPATTVLYAIGGNVSTAAVTQAGMSVILTVFQDICYYGLRPILQICFGFSIVSCLSVTIDLTPIARFVRTTYTTVLVFVISLMTCIMTMQNMLSQSSDSLALRTVKFASSISVPLVGGALGDATSSLAVGLSSVKVTFGVLAVFSIFTMVLPVIISLWFNKIAFSLGGAVASLFGVSKEGMLISSASELINFAIAMVVSVSVMFIINIAVFAKSVSALGG